MKKFILILFLFTIKSSISNAQNCTINAGVTTTYCPNQQMKLYGNISGLYNGSSVTWTQLSGPIVTISNPNSLTTDCGIATSGATYVFKISALCQDGNTISNNVTYNVLNATPTPPPTFAGNTININCLQFGQPINLNATPAPIGFEGTWTIISLGSVLGTFNNIHSSNATFTPEPINLGECPSLLNSYVLRWTLQSITPPPALCPQAISTSSADVTINVGLWDSVDASATTPGCGNSSANVILRGSCPGSGTSNWSLISGPVGFNFNPTNTQVTTITAPPNGNYTFRYTVTGGCINGTKDITFNVDLGGTFFVTNAIANAGGINTGFCNGIPSSIQLAANNPNANEIGTWAQINGGTSVSFSNIHDPHAIVSGLSNAGAPYTFKWTISNNIGCITISPITISNIDIGNNSEINYTLPCGTPVITNGPPAIDGGNYCSTFSKYITAGTYINTQIPIPDNSNNGWYFKGFNLYSKPINATNTIGFTAGQTFFNSNETVSPFNSSVKDCNGPGFGFIFAPNGGFFGINQALSTPYIPGVYQGSWVLKNNLCQAEIVIPFKLTYTGNTTLSNAGTDQNLACTLTQTNLSGNNPLLSSPFYGQGIWEQLSGPNSANIANKYDKSTLVSNLISGTYAFVWRINSGDFCISNQDTVNIRVSAAAPSAVFAGNNQTICYNTQATVTAALAVAGSLQNMLTSTGSTGTWSQVSGPAGAIISNPTNISTTLIGLIANSIYVFRYTASNLCGTKTSDITITTSSFQGPSIANAGANICLNAGTTNTTLTAVAPLVGTGSWIQISGPITTTINNPTNNSTTVTGLTINGIYAFVYTIKTGGCAETKDTVYVSNMATLSTSNAGTDQNICANQGINSFTLNAIAASSGTGTWTQISGPVGATILNPNAFNSIVTVTSNGNYIFRWTISNGGICPDKIDDVAINFYTKPSLAAIITPNTSLCASSNGQIILNANPVTNGIASWSLLSNGPSLITNPTSATTSAVVNTGTTIIRWTVSSVFSGCPSTFADVVIRYTPLANAKNNQNLCRATSTILSSSTPGAGVGLWSVVSQPVGSPSVNFINQGNDSTYSVNPLVAGVYTFRWSVTEATCGTSFDDVVITIDDVTNPYAGADRCDTVGTGVISLVGNAIPVGATALWSKLIGPSGTFSTPTLAATNYTPSATAGNMVFQYQFTKGVCVINDYVQVRIISNVNAGANIVQCNNGNFTLNGSALAIGEAGVWTKQNASDPGIIANINANNTTVTGLNPGDSVNLIWTATTTEGCTKSDTVALINKANVTATTSFSVAAYCDNPTGLNLVGNTPIQGAGSWALISAPAGAPSVIWTNQNSPNANVKNLTMGTYQFRYTLQNLPCAQSTADVLIKSNCLATALPVIIDRFEVQPKNKTVLLNWNVVSQLNINHYTVEHSVDGINFTGVITIVANNLSSFNYQAIHNNPIAGINYYRIKIIENDGSFYYSEIRIVKLNNRNEIEVYPTPSKNLINIVFTLQTTHKMASINIISIDGKVVFKKLFASVNQLEFLDITTIPTGKYILQIITGNQVINKKIEVIK